MKICLAVGILGAMIVAIHASPHRDLDPSPDHTADFGIPKYSQSGPYKPVPMRFQRRSLDSNSEKEYQGLKKSSFILPESDRKGAEATGEARTFYYPDGSKMYTDFIA